MKYVFLSFLLFCAIDLAAQDDGASIFSINDPIPTLFYSNDHVMPNMDFLELERDLKLIAVNTSNPYFQRSYMIDKNGETISSGFMPSAYFLPNDNFIVISGANNWNQDSYNPYGSTDLSSMILFGTVNTVLSKFKFKRRLFGE